MKLHIQTTRDDQRIAWLTALAITIHIAESALPAPIPGVKPGLANIITIICLIHYGWRIAAWVAILRVLVGSILIGTFLSPTFALSLSGAVAAVAVLGLASRLPLQLGPVGYSLLAAMAHMAAQFYTAYALFIPHQGLFHLLPILMTIAVALGIGSGIIAQHMINRIRQVET
ncbi:heptaprenyl diphosphate synthase [Candidatus Tenderia electrophaga]|uniref:Heptaprenyl diphosphate synthase n=1 Tax=Candidatus Tenderia electrophaga TaxID=1748243 RepID=A0A0S2T9T0_9GAMM|nr:heptaprenyl diphosphate synthase [Candidatus Tenderia electrophaga]